MLIDVPPIVARAREVGALVVLDAYQTTGIVPFDVVELDVDIVVGGSHKWLCGGPGCGYIYVKPDAARRASSRWSPAGSRTATRSRSTRRSIDYAKDQFRWATGTPTIPGYLVAKAGHDLIRELGVPAIREHNVRLTTRLTEAALERGWTVNTPRDRAEAHGLGRDRRPRRASACSTSCSSAASSSTTAPAAGCGSARTSTPPTKRSSAS